MAWQYITPLHHVSLWRLHFKKWYLITVTQLRHGITKSLVFCSLYGGGLGDCFATGLGCLNVHYISVFFLAHDAGLWIFSLACWLLWGSPWLLHILFLCMCTTWHTDLTMIVYLLKKMCFCLGTSMSGVHMAYVDTWGRCHKTTLHATLRLRCASTLTQGYFDPFWLQCAGEQSADLPWSGQGSNEVCCFSDSGKWMLLWGDCCDSWAPTVLHSDTQLHKMHSPIIQTTCSLPASLFLSVVWLSCLFVSDKSWYLALRWGPSYCPGQSLCPLWGLSLPRPTWWIADVYFLTVCKTMTVCVS